MNHKEKKKGLSGAARAGSVRDRAFRLALMPAMVAASAGYAGGACAVQGGVVAAGSGTINTQGNTTTISQTSDKMVVNWKNFDIARNQSVTINQPGATSAVLNRVTTASPTQIDGSMTANGRVFVVNPAGVMFGKTAKVDVGSLVASTLNVDDKQFMEGGNTYFGSDGRRALNLSGNSQGVVSNEGKLNAREAVVLLGANAVNSGTIRAKDVTLAAAEGVAMEMNDSGFSVMLGRAAQKALAANYGVISANGGDVKLSAAATGAMLATVVQNTGTLEATRATSGQGGSVILGSELDGNISVGGRVTAEQNISIVASPATYANPPFDGSTQPNGGYYGTTGHNVNVTADAKLNAVQGWVDIETLGGQVAADGRINGGDVSIYAYGGPLTTNGVISGRDVAMRGDGVAINAPINASRNVYVDAAPWNESGGLVQNANIKAESGGINLSGSYVRQAKGVKTLAGDSVNVKAGDVQVSDVNAKSVNIDGGSVTLAGNVKADGDVNVRARETIFNCTAGAGEICAALYSIGGSINQRGNVTSKSGSVVMNADGMISQGASTKTVAATDVKLTAGRDDLIFVTRDGVNFVERIKNSGYIATGKIKAGNQIVIKAENASLGGRLSAREIELPERTANKDGNVRIVKATQKL